MKVFNLPDLGEGLPDAEIVDWHVKEGQQVEVDEPLVSMETAKAVVEVPSPHSGVIAKLHGEKGDTINTGAPLVSFDAIEDSQKKDTGTVVGKVEVGETVVQEKVTQVSKAGGVKIMPAVRALAKKLEVDLASITPTGPDGTITKEDVQTAHGQKSQSSPMEPLKGVRRMMAITMQQSHQEVVPVTIYDDADISDWEDKDYTSRMLKAIVFACSKEPALNGYFDGKAMARRLLEECHVGLAMDTEEGLFVPVIENVQDKTPAALRDEINTLKQEVKARTVKPEQLKGNTITLSNFGNFAGRYASPIIVPPTMAIIAVGKIREEVRAVKGDPMVRTIMPISLSFDHRAVTGGEATRFLGHLLESLQKPSL